MNKLSNYLLTKINNNRKIEQEYLESLFQYYEGGSRVLHYCVDIKKEEFQELFHTIHDILRLRVEEDRIEDINEHYLKLLMADARDGHTVDAKWAIDHIWYLGVGIANAIFPKKDRECIPFIQQKLIHKFDIQENWKEKGRRKVYTKWMINT